MMKVRQRIKIQWSVVLFPLVVGCNLFSFQKDSQQTGQETQYEQIRGQNPQKMPSEQDESEQTQVKLSWEELKVGTGDLVSGAGSELTVEYIYRILGSDRVIEDSRKRSEVFKFTLGANQVIPGWDEGLAGMKAGGLRRLLIPPEMAYGKRGISGLIPPDSFLEFEIELIGLKNPNK